jgi:hypothetical protein
METKDLLAAYNVIQWAMTQNKRASHNQAFVVVMNWLANRICEQLELDTNNNK